MMMVMMMSKVLVALAAVALVSAFDASIVSELKSLLNHDVPAQEPKADGSCPVPLACPPGWSGRYCDVELCDNKGIVPLPHPDQGFPIDVQVFKSQCQASISLPVDSHAGNIYLQVDGTSAAAKPSLTLYDSNGKEVPLHDVFTNTSETIGVQYDLSFRPGRYTVHIKASTPCTYWAHCDSDTILLPVAFVSGERATHNDQGHSALYDGELSYAIASTKRLWHPGYVRVLEIYADGELLHGYDARTRYKCNYDTYFGPLTCNAGTNYYYKIIGIDDNGFDIQRTDLVACKKGEFTTTPGPSTTPEGPCLHGGTYKNGKCYCTRFWSGDKCETTVCFNGGTRTPDNECSCPMNFSGWHCQEAVCTQQHVVPIWGPNFRSLGIVLQTTSTNSHSIYAFQDYVTSIIQDIVQHDGSFIIQYSLHTFDDKDATTRIVTTDPYEFMEYVHHTVVSNDTAAANKKSTKGLIHALSNAIEYGSVYVFTDSPDVNDATEVLNAKHLIGHTHAKINYFVTAPRQGKPDDAGWAVIDRMAQLGNGIVYKPDNTFSGIYQVIETIQMAYMDSTVAEGVDQSCTTPQTIDVPIDSGTIAWSVTVQGKNPKITIKTPLGVPYHDAIAVINDTSVLTWEAITPCPRYWDQRNHNCYFAQVTPMTWKDAQQYCRNQGAILVSVLNNDRQMFLDQEVGGKVDYWTGLNDIDNEGAYVWDSDAYQQPVGHYYLNWGANQPDDGTHTKNCIATLHTDGKPKWYNKACTDKLPFICERHAFDKNNKDAIPPGKWQVAVKVDDGPCSYSVHSQSDLQVYYGFNQDIFNDYPTTEPAFGKGVTNYVIANVSEQVLFPGSRYPWLDHVTFYSTDYKALSRVNVNSRRNCTAYEYVSEDFDCPAEEFGVVFEGRDYLGYTYTRVRSTDCFNPNAKVDIDALIADYRQPISGSKQ